MLAVFLAHMGASWLPRSRLQIENAMLRHQLAVYRRSIKRPIARPSGERKGQKQKGDAHRTLFIPFLSTDDFLQMTPEAADHNGRGNR